MGLRNSHINPHFLIQTLIFIFTDGNMISWNNKITSVLEDVAEYHYTLVQKPELISIRHVSSSSSSPNDITQIITTRLPEV